MHTFFDLNPTEQTVQKFLNMFACFGPRFQLWYGQEEWFPHDLLLDFTQITHLLLFKRCQ